MGAVSGHIYSSLAGTRSKTPQIRSSQLSFDHQYFIQVCLSEEHRHSIPLTLAHCGVGTFLLPPGHSINLIHSGDLDSNSCALLSVFWKDSWDVSHHPFIFQMHQHLKTRSIKRKGRLIRPLTQTNLLPVTFTLRPKIITQCVYAAITSFPHLPAYIQGSWNCKLHSGFSNMFWEQSDKNQKERLNTKKRLPYSLSRTDFDADHAYAILFFPQGK